MALYVDHSFVAVLPLLGRRYLGKASAPSFFSVDDRKHESEPLCVLQDGDLQHAEQKHHHAHKAVQLQSFQKLTRACSIPEELPLGMISLGRLPDRCPGILGMLAMSANTVMACLGIVDTSESSQRHDKRQLEDQPGKNFLIRSICEDNSGGTLEHKLDSQV